MLGWLACSSLSKGGVLKKPLALGGLRSLEDPWCHGGDHCRSEPHTVGQIGKLELGMVVLLYWGSGGVTHLLVLDAWQAQIDHHDRSAPCGEGSCHIVAHHILG